MSAASRPDTQPDSQRYPMAPLIRFTLISLYLALVAPLPLLAPAELQPLLWGALPLGLLLILALLSEQVELSSSGLAVGYPAWCRWLWRRGWQLNWDQVSSLVPVRTSQGGSVYYVRNRTGEAFLLPQRVAHFDDFLTRFSQHTGIDTSAIGRISPAWTYQLLAVLCGSLLLAELAAGLWWRFA